MNSVHENGGAARAEGGSLETEIRAEQSAVDRAYARVDDMRRSALGVVRHHRGLGELASSQARVEWESLLALTDQRLQHLELGGASLCFGRLNRSGGETFQIGRLSVLDEAGEPLVVDWRAPAAEAFYQATGRNPMGLVRRRHLLTRGRTVIGVDDEVFDLQSADDDRLEIVGEGALLASLERSRTGRMGDIVATIQAEQDQIIRAALPGVLIVQGGPGTGKTAVALHRAAYLLYANRQRLEDAGVLVVGPNRTFLRYIEHVLPSLGESGVELQTVEGLYGRAHATATEPLATERVKGDARMAAFLARAVRDRERSLPGDLHVPYGSVVLRVPQGELSRLVDQFRARRGPHNAHQAAFVRRLKRLLWRTYLRMLERRSGPEVPQLDPDDNVVELFGSGRELTQLRREREEERFQSTIGSIAEVREAVERMWPLLTPEELLHDLFGAPALLRLAARGTLESDEALALFRPRSRSVTEVRWTVADLALLDEAATLLGAPPARYRRRQATLRENTRWMIEETIDDVTLNTGELDPEMRRALIARLTETEQAALGVNDDDGEPTVYGHVIVDEAQDVSAMQWRMIGRRVPGGSMTIVGDLGQASRAGAVASWDEVIAQLPVRREPRLLELTVNYRTPAEIMTLAASVLAVTDPGLEPPTSVRRSGHEARFVHTTSDRLLEGAVGEVRRLLEVVEDGKIALIVPTGWLADARAAIRSLPEGIALGEGADSLDAAVALLQPNDAKGLEFDAVVLTEPAELAGEGIAGLRGLYVALTRATRWLSVVHADALPEPIARARSAST